MSQPTARTRSPLRVTIVSLSVTLLAMAALVAFLIWGGSTPTMTSSPTPTSSATMPTTSFHSPTATPTSPTVASPFPTPSHSLSTSEGTTTGSPSDSPSAGQTMMWEGKATFDHLTVEVLADDADQDVDVVAEKAGLLVEVCVTKPQDSPTGTRITADSWTLEDSENNVQTPQRTGFQPAFPVDGKYAVGECARGYLTFDYLSVESDFALLVYADGLGNRAVWQFH